MSDNNEINEMEKKSLGVIGREGLGRTGGE